MSEKFENAALKDSDIKQKKGKKGKQWKPKTRTFLRGPKRDALPKVDANSGDELLQSAKKLAASLKSANSDGTQPKHNSEKRKESCMRDELIFGLNGVLRNIEKGVAIGVIANDPLSINIQETICDIAVQKKIPIVFVSGFADLKIDFNISNLTCLAFKPSVTNSTAIFNELYNLFLQTSLQFECNKHECNDIEFKNNISEESKTNCDASQPLTAKSEVIFKFAKPDFDDLYFPKNTCVDDILVTHYAKSVEQEREIYFPARCIEKLIDVVVDFDKQHKKNIEDKEFAKILMETDDEEEEQKSTQTRKRKRKSHQSSPQTAKYVSVDMIQLLPSSNEAKKKNKNKKVSGKKVENKK